MTTAPATAEADEMKAFLLVVRQALLLVVRWIERKYHVGAYKEQG